MKLLPYECTECHFVEYAPSMGALCSQMGWVYKYQICLMCSNCAKIPYEPKIEVYLTYPSATRRKHDWVAYFDGKENSACYGYTAKEAMERLIIQYIDDLDPE